MSHWDLKTVREPIKGAGPEISAATDRKQTQARPRAGGPGHRESGGARAARLRRRARVDLHPSPSHPTPTTMSESIKGPAPPPAKLDGSPLRVAIVHLRWNKTVIDALVAGTIAKLKETGVKESNIVVQSVPGAFELPLASSK